MWKNHGKPEIPYTLATMQQSLAAISNPSFADNFFKKYITGHEPINYAALLAKAGYIVKKSNEGKAVSGLNLKTNERDSKLVIASTTTRGTAAYEAGLDINDEILLLDETPMKTPTDVNNYMLNKKPGDIVKVTYKHRGKEKTTSLTLKENSSLTIVDMSTIGQTITDDMKKIRDSWFTSKTNQ